VNKTNNQIYPRGWI